MRTMKSWTKCGLLMLLSSNASCFKNNHPHENIEQSRQFIDRKNDRDQELQDHTIAKHVPPISESLHTVKANSNLYSELRTLSLSPQEIIDLIEKSRPFTSLDRVSADFAFKAQWREELSEKILVGLEFLISDTQSLFANRNDNSWQIKLEDFPIEKVAKTFTGTVASSLWESAVDIGVDPSMIVQLTEIFAWQVDFSREVQPGDQWRLVVEERFSRNKAIGWGPILAAQYVNQGETYTAVKFPQEGPGGAYFTPEGQSLKRMFLKSPIKFGRISSKFSQKRFHPILKETRPHLGVDYAAPIGTPVRAVGKGRIVYLGRNGGSGKMIKIRHNSTYQTAYLHLNGYAKGLRTNSVVEQGQIIGYVGQTGLATGPHLHFAFYENGRYVDPLGRKFPSADPVASDDLKEFKLLSEQILTQLPDWRFALQDSAKETGH